MQRLKNLKVYVYLVIASVLASFLLGFAYGGNAYVAAEETSPNRLAVHFLDVKQGDCIIIELPDGKNMIIDAGSGTQEDNSITRSVLDYIDTNLGSGFTNFDYAILTHTDSDHCNILDNVLNAYPSYVCYRPNVEATNNGYTDPGKSDLFSGAKAKPTATYKKVIESMYKTINGVANTVYVVDPEDENQTITGGSGEDAYSLTFFSPLSHSYTDSNDYSPIMLLQYRGFKFALSGDAEKENEREFVKRVNDAKTDGVTDKYDIFDDDFCVDVFKAGHHGSETSSSQDYLDVMTSPSGAKDVYYIFSCNAAGNKYYHPRQQVLDRVVAMGATNDTVKRTDHHGTISVTVSGGESGYSLSCTTAIEYNGTNLIGADEEKNGSGGGNTGDNTGDGNTGGGTESGNENDKADKADEGGFWDRLTKTQKILIIVAAVVTVMIIIIILICLKRRGVKIESVRGNGSKSGKKSGSGKRKQSGKGKSKK